MGRYLFLLLLTVVFVARGDALTRVSGTTEELQVFRSGVSSSLSNQILHRRFLRSSDSLKTTNGAENVINEERSIIALTKLKTATKKIFDVILKPFKKADHWFMKRLQNDVFERRYRNGETPDNLFKRLGLSTTNERWRYNDYEEYRKFWTKKKGTIK
ncbi:RxLR effector protein [Phytophthora megakarya]|uniref:RxLR effector protein n=1 Tax=Phytophthora megakarya TaxID=4795 RepID=A0A225V6W6_9STRA|nr:RxLR effector protein [Phytophthora megakarya]